MFYTRDVTCFFENKWAGLTGWLCWKICGSLLLPPWLHLRLSHRDHCLFWQDPRVQGDWCRGRLAALNCRIGHTLIYIFSTWTNEIQYIKIRTRNFFRLLASLPTRTSPILPGSPSPANKEDLGDSATPSCQILISRSPGWQELHSAYIPVFKISCEVHEVIQQLMMVEDFPQ